MKNKIQEFESPVSAMVIGAYRFAGRNVLRAYGSDADVARALFALGEVAVPAVIHHAQVTDQEPEMWAERPFPSRNAALTFLFGQAIRFGLRKRGWD